MVGADDIEASQKFQDAVLGTLNIAPGVGNRNRWSAAAMRLFRHHDIY